MIDYDHGVDPGWQGRVLLWMVDACLRDPDPQVRFDFWVDEAGEADDNYIVWALKTWDKVVLMPVFQLEELQDKVHHWLEKHGQFAHGK